MDSYGDYIEDIITKLIEQLFKGKTTEGIENIMKEILTMCYSSVELKYLTANYDITQHNPVWIFRNCIAQTYCHGLYMDVTFMTANNGWFLIPSNMNYFHYHKMQIMQNFHFLVSIWIQCLFAFKLNSYATIR